MFGCFSYALDGNHPCLYCYSIMNLRFLTRWGRAKRWASGAKGSHCEPFIMTIDRRLPAICRGCNMLKSGFTFPHFQVLLGTFILFATTNLSNDDFLTGTENLTVETPLLQYISEEEVDFLWKWAGQKEAQAAHHAERQKGDMTRTLYYRLARIVYAGKGLYRDPSGIDLPLYMADVDRLDPKAGTLLTTPDSSLALSASYAATALTMAPSTPTSLGSRLRPTSTITTASLPSASACPELAQPVVSPATPLPLTAPWRTMETMTWSGTLDERMTGSTVVSLLVEKAT